MDCFLDFCLACDKQTTDGLYCSQACRLADLEKAGGSAPASPCSIERDNWTSPRTNGSSAFSLPLSFDFGASKSDTKSQTSSPNSSSERKRVLSPSTSRSSLNSTASIHTSQAISQQTQHELNDYVSSFDSVREMKRRSLSSNTGY